MAYVIIGIALLLQVGCQMPKPPKAAEIAKGKKGPKITFEKLIYDFNEVGPGTKNTGELKFKNTGDSLLTITKVEGCCGVFAKLDKESRQYEPGESGTVKIEYNAGSGTGQMRKQLFVVSNDPATPKTEIVITQS
jgi:hypothetical protein